MNYRRFLYDLSDADFIDYSFLSYLYNAVIPRIIYAYLFSFSM